jgi:hypothetical protein
MKKLEQIISNSDLAKVAAYSTGELNELVTDLVKEITKADGVIIYSKELPAELKTKLDDVTDRLKSVKAITDEATAESANKTLAEGKRLIKKIQDEALELRRPMNTAADDVILFEKKTIEDLQAIVKVVNDNIVTFKKLQDEIKKKADEELKRQAQEKAAKETERINRIFALIGKVRENIVNKLAEITTVEACDEAIKKLNGTNFDASKYEEFLPNVQKVKTEMLAKLEEKKTKLQEAIDNMEETGEVIDKVIEEVKQEGESLAARVDFDNNKELEETKLNALQNIQMETELKTSVLKGAKSASRPWIYQGIEDITKVPAEFFSVDEAKVKAAIKAGRYSIPGLIIEQDLRNISR